MGESLIPPLPPQVQLLSVRGALYQMLNATPSPLRLIFVDVPKGYRIDNKAAESDFLHVSLLGHRW